MDGNYKPYDYEKSSERIAEIVKQSSSAFEEKDSLPDRDRLTFNNGFSAYCSAVFIDIRDSSSLTEKHSRSELAKIYRAFISEMVAVLNGSNLVREVNIVGDCVWGVYNTPFKPDIDAVFSLAATANTLVKLLNHHLSKSSLTELSVGIGIDYGKALMIKAGFNGSGINEVVYMGDVVNRAAHLAHEAGRGYRDPIFSGSVFASNLNDHNKGLLKSEYFSALGTIYRGNAVSTAMNEWVGGLT